MTARKILLFFANNTSFLWFSRKDWISPGKSWNLISRSPSITTWLECSIRMNHEWHLFLCINYERNVCLKQNLSQNSMVITFCRWTRSDSGRVFENNAWRCIMQCIPTMFGLCFLASFKNLEREPSIAGAPSVQIPTTFSQLKPSVVKKSDITFKTSCSVLLLVSPRQNKKLSKILPSWMYFTNTMSCEMLPRLLTHKVV